ncbi:MAG: ABC transporter permease subunit [Gammaproteobacteria bacterium]|nr:ABC transporter permease subunit [Gammaproteobacteria bacterium]
MSATSKAGTQPGRLSKTVTAAAWWIASVALFVAIWEFCWYMRWANPMLMPPPHIFLQDILFVGKLFDKSTRLGNPSAGLIALTIAKTIGASTLRVVCGLAVALVVSLVVGMAIRYSPLFGRLILPVINLLAPVSPIAWLPVAMLVFGLGNAPAIFLVYIALFFIMTLATLNLIDTLPPSYVQVARIMGASRLQIFVQVILPAILPGLFVVLRLNLFAAWMIVLIAESVGVGGGLGLVVIISRNTFDAQLAFFTMFIIGIVGFLLDVALREIQRRALYWQP